MKFTMVNTDNSFMYINSDGIVHVTTTVMEYDKDNDVIITWRNNGITTWEINKHYIRSSGTHWRGIGDENHIGNSRERLRI